MQWFAHAAVLHPTRIIQGGRMIRKCGTRLFRAAGSSRQFYSVSCCFRHCVLQRPPAARIRLTLRRIKEIHLRRGFGSRASQVRGGPPGHFSQMALPLLFAAHRCLDNSLPFSRMVTKLGAGFGAKLCWELPQTVHLVIQKSGRGKRRKVNSKAPNGDCGSRQATAGRPLRIAW